MIARWDDDLAYCSRAMRDSYDLKEAWKKIAQKDVPDLKQEYRIRQIQQDNIDSHDVQRDISPKEKQLGLRAGLLEFQRKCVCGEEPKSRNVPVWPKRKCIHCGGN
jgi:mobilome CxxCx(11)CxxC protein